MALKGRAPNKAEREHMDRVSDLGCVVCRMRGYYGVPAEIHHIEGKTRKGSHFRVLPLCFNHHRGGRDSEPVSRHPYKRRFIDAYGTEEELLRKVDQYLQHDSIEDDYELF